MDIVTATMPALADASAPLFSVDNLLALLTLTALEIVLGIDNIVVISIVTGKLPHARQNKARLIGLALAMIMRILLLLCISWIMGLTKPLFTVPVFELGISGKDLILLLGGLFLIYKATHEIHEIMEGGRHVTHPTKQAATTFGAAITTILLMDIVFSLDSVITAVGMADQILIMVAAVMIAVGVMMVFSGMISEFIKDHPTIKMLALSFLLLIGVILTAEGVHQHIDKKYIYFAMGFALIVELLNLRVIKKQVVQIG